jgi:uncharacterized caspase-like protein
MVLRFFVTLALIGLSFTEALAQRRVAVLIGNTNYAHAERLVTPQQDVDDLGGVFRAAGFDDVAVLKDQTLAQLRERLRAFARTSAGADAAVIVFSGLSLTSPTGSGYLLPVDARLDGVDAISRQAIPVAELFDAVGRASKDRLVILDASRFNAFVRSLQTGGNQRAVANGPGRLAARDGHLFVSAAGEGQTAEDAGEGARNSPFVAALLAQLQAGNLDVQAAIDSAARAVQQATGGRQRPIMASGQGFGPMYLNRRSQPAPVASVSVAPPPTARPSIDTLRPLWESLRTSRNISAMDAFLEQVRGTALEPEVAARIAELRLQEAAAWEAARRADTMIALQRYMTEWDQGPNSAAARRRMELLEDIRRQWDVLQASDDEAALTNFVRDHGWSEFGPAATARVVALKKEKSSPADPNIKVLTGAELTTLLIGKTLRVPGAGDVLTFPRVADQSFPFVKAVGPGFMAKVLQRPLIHEGAFQGTVNLENGTKSEARGFVAILASDVDKTGTAIFMQMHGPEKKIDDLNRRNRLAHTFNVIQDQYGFVCVMTEWHQLSALPKSKRPFRCVAE